MIINGPVSQSVQVSESLELSCIARNNMDSTRTLVFMWLFIPADGRDQVFIDDDGVRMITNFTVDQEANVFGSRINITNARPSDGGQYICHVYNRLLSDALTADANVTVLCKCVSLVVT